jgi:hypothetical protein
LKTSEGFFLAYPTFKRQAKKFELNVLPQRQNAIRFAIPQTNNKEFFMKKLLLTTILAVAAMGANAQEKQENNGAEVAYKGTQVVMIAKSQEGVKQILNQMRADRAQLASVKGANVERLDRAISKFETELSKVNAAQSKNYSSEVCTHVPISASASAAAGNNSFAMASTATHGLFFGPLPPMSSEALAQLDNTFDYQYTNRVASAVVSGGRSCTAYASAIFSCHNVVAAAYAYDQAPGCVIQ